MKLYTSLFLALALAGCASTGPKGGLPKTIPLEFKGKTGEVTQTRYYSNSRSMQYQDGQLLRDRTEGVEFIVENHVTKYDPAKKLLEFELRTTVKDGTVPLHDLAFPELHERLEYVVRGDGEVLRVSNLPPTSLFFVPAMPIPNGPVAVGDTWTMEHEWLSAKDGIPLRLEVVAILKDIVPCEQKNICADIELSGHVSLVAMPNAPGAHFSSRLWGRLLFSLERGDVLWSEMRSSEEMGAKAERMAVRSCMVSEMKIGAPQIKFDCNPNDDAVSKTPVY